MGREIIKFWYTAVHAESSSYTLKKGGKKKRDKGTKLNL